MMRPAVLSGNASDGGVSDRRTGSSAGRPADASPHDRGQSSEPGYGFGLGEWRGVDSCELCAPRVRGDPAVFALAVGDREVQAEWVHRGSPGSLSRDREVMKLETRQRAAIGRSLTSAA
jgi:hypothetical protein